MTRWGSAAVAAFTAVTLAGCDVLPFGYTPVAEIVAAPANFEGKEVKLQGKVASITKLPMFDYNAYTLREGTAEIAVVTQDKLPAAGDAVALRGIVKSAAIIGGQALGLQVQETKRLR